METTSPVRIKRSTKERLNNLGTVKDTYDTIIIKLLDYYEKHEKK